MGKTDAYRQVVLPLLGSFVGTRSAEELSAYLRENSNLPGPRGNLELAAAFAAAVRESGSQKSEPLWDLLKTMTAVTALEAPTGHPDEFVVFCGTVGIGALGAVCPAYSDMALSALRSLASDPRWRVREGVAMALQQLLLSRAWDTVAELGRWVERGDLLQLRAAAAGVAEPAVLKQPGMPEAALELHRGILPVVAQASDRRSEAFRVLRQALGYTLSVVVCELPESGFAFLRELMAANDVDVLWIVNQNLKKNRLLRRFPDRVQALRVLT
jgi:hypothetical protein